MSFPNGCDFKLSDDERTPLEAFMLYFRSCPRCKTGAIQLESDFFGDYLSCVNCGFQKNSTSMRKSDFSESALSVEEQLMSSTVTPINPEMDDSDEPNVLRQATG